MPTILDYPLTINNHLLYTAGILVWLQIGRMIEDYPSIKKAKSTK